MTPLGLEAGGRTPIDTVLLDAGGVLLDLDFAYILRLIGPLQPPVAPELLSRTEALARREINETVRRGGRVSDAWRDYFYIILGKMGVGASDHDAIINRLWEAHQRVGLWTVAIPGAPEAVAGLRDRGLTVGVVSNAEGQVARDLDIAGYRGMFQTVVDSHHVGIEKPDPGIFRIALERIGRSAETTVFIGDIPLVDVDGARAAGIRPLLFDRHDLYPEVDAPRIRSFDELPDLLAQ